LLNKTELEQRRKFRDKNRDFWLICALEELFAVDFWVAFAHLSLKKMMLPNEGLCPACIEAGPWLEKGGYRDDGYNQVSGTLAEISYHDNRAVYRLLQYDELELKSKLFLLIRKSNTLNCDEGVRGGCSNGNSLSEDTQPSHHLMTLGHPSLPTFSNTLSKQGIQQVQHG
jgi:hypothetical protein